MSTEDKLEKQERQTKILVVDDDVRLRDLLRRYLAENGFAVTTAENADRKSTRLNSSHAT